MMWEDEVRTPQRKVHRAPRKQVLMAASKADAGPWCPIAFVKQIEVLGAHEKDVVRIEVRDGTRVSSPNPYHIRGSCVRSVNIPRGAIRVVRVRGSEPITVYAYCGE